MKKIVALPALVVFTFSIFSPLGFSAPAASPEAYKTQAANNIQVANQLMQEAKQILQSGNLNRNALETALNLYIQAGKLFEKTVTIYKTLGPNYVSTQSIQGASQALKNCLETVKQIKSRLQR